MKNHWAKEFYDLAQSNGLNCKLVTLMNGWFETLLLEGKLCFTKSFTYNTSRRQYFQGVDLEKLDENGDLVLLCGSITGSLRDIFIIPWDKFFATLRRGEPINTYRPPKKYFGQACGTFFDILTSRIISVMKWGHEMGSSLWLTLAQN